MKNETSEQIVLRFTRSQHMALVGILGDRLRENPSYVDCSQNPPVETRASDLFKLAMGLVVELPAAAPQPERKRLRRDVTDAERLRARKMRKKGVTIARISRELERQPATVELMLKPRKGEAARASSNGVHRGRPPSFRGDLHQLHARVVELQKTHSLRAISKKLGVPLPRVSYARYQVKA